MSTIEKILLSLQANGNDKKNTLTNSYQEKSVWLRNEFDVIRKLIKQNPRENLTNQEPELASIDPAVSSSSSAVREQSGDGRKRKSPETVNAVKLSPQQKRSSIDVDDLVHQAGLPTDLNKLKKEQLLVELEKRGNTQFSMKHVKNVLIDALKDTLLSEHQNREAPEQPILQNASAIPSDSITSSAPAPETESSSMVLSTPSKQAVRGSLMSDFRSLVQNNNAGVSAAGSNALAKPEVAAVEQKKRIEDEYNARMHRQRESIAARKSVLVEVAAPVAILAPVSAIAPPASTVVTETPVVPEVVAPIVAPVSAPTLSLAAPTAAQKDSIGSTASGDSIWMEVSSPVRTSTAQANEEVSVESVGAVVSAPLSVRPRTESDSSFQSCASSGSNVPKATASAATASSSAKSGSVATNSSSSVRPIASKMSTYNTDKPMVAKSVVPSVMKAKLGVKPEETKAATVLKKKDPIPENKPMVKPSTTVSAPAQSVRPATATTITTAPAPAPVVTAPAAAPVPAPVVAAAAPTPVVAPVAAPADSATANAAPAKRGIFGFLSNSKKNITATPTAAPAAGSATPLTGSGLFSPTAQTAAKPAMVDSIIKSAKMDTVAPSSTSTTSTLAPASAVKAPTSEGAVTGLSGSGKLTAGTSSAPLKDAFASKSLISNIVNNYNNAIKTPAVAAPVAAQVASTPAPKPVVATNDASVLRDITSTTNAPATAVKPAAQPATAVPSTLAVAAAAAPVSSEEYVIEDRDDSDESGTDGEGEEDNKKPKQNVPEWARGPLLKEALERQYGLGGQVPVDPDLIFPEVTTCSLEEIFGAREGLSRKYANRSSSAHWDADQMTLVEKRSYRKHMGYDRGQTAGALGAK